MLSKASGTRISGFPTLLYKEASAGGGMVTARVNGSHQVLSIEIKPEAVDPDDVEMLQDMVVAAVNAAFAKATESMEKQMAQITGGMNLPGGLF